MSHTSWSPSTHLGSTSPYHQDPHPGGAPVVTPDGHWRWIGDHWELRDDPEDDGASAAEDGVGDDVPPAPPD